ncbi:hypothetical protein [Shimia sp. NS0008-38b]|uniref:hypothetical protein n=1 Tax=Shimia sp. NS0008-38b TaxID=3127653 RepID=UPI003342C5FF
MAMISGVCPKQEFDRLYEGRHHPNAEWRPPETLGDVALKLRPKLDFALSRLSSKLPELNADLPGGILGAIWFIYLAKEKHPHLFSVETEWMFSPSSYGNSTEAWLQALFVQLYVSDDNTFDPEQFARICVRAPKSGRCEIYAMDGEHYAYIVASAEYVTFIVLFCTSFGDALYDADTSEYAETISIGSGNSLFHERIINHWFARGGEPPGALDGLIDLIVASQGGTLSWVLHHFLEHPYDALIDNVFGGFLTAISKVGHPKFKGKISEVLAFSPCYALSFALAHEACHIFEKELNKRRSFEAESVADTMALRALHMWTSGANREADHLAAGPFLGLAIFFASTMALVASFDASPSRDIRLRYDDGGEFGDVAKSEYSILRARFVSTLVQSALIGKSRSAQYQHNLFSETLLILDLLQSDIFLGVPSAFTPVQENTGLGFTSLVHTVERLTEARLKHRAMVVQLFVDSMLDQSNQIIDSFRENPPGA